VKVVLSYLVQSKDLDLTAPSYQPAEVIDASMIDVDVECVRKRFDICRVISAQTSCIIIENPSSTVYLRYLGMEPDATPL
jgi:hypothetical protein